MNDSIPKRGEVPSKYKWNLSQLFASDQTWEKDLAKLGLMQAGIEGYKTRLAASETDFLAALSFYSEYLRLDEKLGNYAGLRTAEDEGDSVARSLFARYMSLATSGQAAWAWLTPSIQALPEAFIAPCMKDSRFSDYRIFLEKLIRFKPYILSEKEERILAMQAETNQIPRETFGVLTNVDLDFGKIRTGEGFRPLSQSAFASLMRNKDRMVRRAAYRKFYRSLRTAQDDPGEPLRRFGQARCLPGPGPRLSLRPALKPFFPTTFPIRCTTTSLARSMKTFRFCTTTMGSGKKPLASTN